MASIKDSVRNVLESELQQRKNIKIFCSIMVEFEKVDPCELDKVLELTRGFTSFAHALLSMQMFSKFWHIPRDFSDYIEDFTVERSGWKVRNIRDFQMVIVTYRPLFGGNYIPLPRELQEVKQVCLNIDNSEVTPDGDHLKCFLWSVLAALCPLPQNTNQYKHDKKVGSYKLLQNLAKINDKGIKYPVTIKQIRKFEKLNPNVSFTIIAYDLDVDVDTSELEADEDTSARHKLTLSAKTRYQIFQERTYLLHTSEIMTTNHIDLLLLMKDGKSHFCLIKDLGKFTKPPSGKHGRFVCRRCLAGFRNESILSHHQEYCSPRIQKVTFPEENQISFQRYKTMIKVPFVIYADFVALSSCS